MQLLINKFFIASALYKRAPPERVELREYSDNFAFINRIQAIYYLLFDFRNVQFTLI